MGADTRSASQRPPPVEALRARARAVFKEDGPARGVPPRSWIRSRSAARAALARLALLAQHSDRFEVARSNSTTSTNQES